MEKERKKVRKKASTLFYYLYLYCIVRRMKQKHGSIKTENNSNGVKMEEQKGNQRRLMRRSTPLLRK